MCFNSHKNNEYVGPNGPLPKSTTNDRGFSFESVLSDIWNGAKNGFERVASLELGLWEAEKLADLRNTEMRNALDKTESYGSYSGGGSWNNPDQGMTGNNQLMLIAGAGLAALAVYLVAKEL